MIELLGPEQPGIRLALNASLIFIQPRRLDGSVELVGLAHPPLDDRVEVAERVVERGRVKRVLTARHPPGAIIPW